MGDRERTTWWHRLRTVLLLVLSLLLTAIIGVRGYTELLLNKIGRDPDSTVGTVAEQTVPADSALMETATKGARTGVINILLIGQDRRPGQKKNARSDAIILCTVNHARKTVTLTSFLRDMYVQIPGKNSNRINAAYALGGMKLLNSCIQENFGVNINGNVAVDFAAFTQAIDLVGGVDIWLSAKEADYLNTTTYKDQPHWNTGLTEGINHLDGNLALAYARIRKLKGNDFGRTQRQRKVLSALADKVSKLTLPELHRFMKGLLVYVTTDMTNAQILGYALDLLPALKNYQVESLQIPSSGTFSNRTVDGMQVLVPDLRKNRQILEKIMS